MFPLLLLVNMAFLNVANSAGLSKLVLFDNLRLDFWLCSSDTLVLFSRKALKHGGLLDSEKSCYFFKLSTQSGFILNYGCAMPVAL